MNLMAMVGPVVVEKHDAKCYFVWNPSQPKDLEQMRAVPTLNRAMELARQFAPDALQI